MESNGRQQPPWRGTAARSGSGSLLCGAHEPSSSIMLKSSASSVSDTFSGVSPHSVRTHCHNPR